MIKLAKQMDKLAQHSIIAQFFSKVNTFNIILMLIFYFFSTLRISGITARARSAKIAPARNISPAGR